MIGMVGLANKPGGYSQCDVEFLEPFLLTCSNLIQAFSAIQENRRLINTLEDKVAERTRELSHANEHLEAANRKVMAASAAQLTNFACMSHEIRSVSHQANRCCKRPNLSHSVLLFVNVIGLR